MALFTISDLHLPLGIDKPMDIFGKGWENYVERIESEWKRKVASGDTVVLGGDFSWATYLEESERDFDFLDALPGRKILLKGNHDYWWTTVSKLKGFVKAHNYHDIEFLHNNFFMYKDAAICGSRGWGYIGVGAPKKKEDETIFERELIRLELSLSAAMAAKPKEIIAFTHYPPILPGSLDNRITALLKKYGVKRCIYGHIHGAQKKNAVEGVYDGVKYMLVSCDCIGFSPVKLCD